MLYVSVAVVTTAHAHRPVLCGADLVAVESDTTVGRRMMRCSAAGLKMTLVAS